VQAVVSVVQIGLSLLLVSELDPLFVSTGLAAAWSVASLVGSVLGLALLSRRVGTLHGGRFAGYLLVVTIAAVPGSLLVLLGVLQYSWFTTGSSLGALAAVAAGSAVAGVVYVGVAWVLRVGPVRDGISRAVALARRHG
jgi:peptidoglycan biosynthesis protein MviN/MurJ (putative lipid II flippase)